MFTLGAMPEPAPRMSGPSDIIAGGYTMIPQKFYNPNPARNALGLVAGNDVSIASGNLVDLESDLRGISRDLSRAPSKQYQPSCPLGSVGSAAAAADITSGLAPIGPGAGGCPAWPKQLVFAERGTGKVVTVNTTPRHLPTIQMSSFPGVPAPEPFIQVVHGSPWRF